MSVWIHTFPPSTVDLWWRDTPVGSSPWGYLFQSKFWCCDYVPWTGWLMRRSCNIWSASEKGLPAGSSHEQCCHTETESVSSRQGPRNREISSFPRITCQHALQLNLKTSHSTALLKGPRTAIPSIKLRNLSTQLFSSKPHHDLCF